MGKIIFIKKEKKDIKGTIVNAAIIICAVLFVGALAVMVSNNKQIGNRIKEISYSEFKEQIKSPDYTVVLLASPYCSHCQEYKPFVNGLAEEYDFKVYYINVHSDKLKPEEYNELHDTISATKDQFTQEGESSIPTPTTAIFKDGVEVASKLGDIGYEGLKELLKDNGVI